MEMEEVPAVKVTNLSFAYGSGGTKASSLLCLGCRMVNGGAHRHQSASRLCESLLRDRWTANDRRCLADVARWQLWQFSQNVSVFVCVGVGRAPGRWACLSALPVLTIACRSWTK
jgi:hypothetical protein